MMLLPIRTEYLSPAEFGILGTLISIGGLITPLLLLGTTGAIVRAYYEREKSKSDFSSYLMSTWLGVSIFSIVVVFLIEVLGSIFWVQTSIAEKIPFHPFVSLTLVKVLAAVLGTSLLLPVFRAMQKPWWFAGVSLGSWVLLTVAGLYGLVTYGLEGQILAETVVAVLVGILVIAMMWKMFRPEHYRWTHFKSALSFGLPLVPHMLALWVMNLSDRILLASMVPMTDVGLYNIAMSLAILMVFVISSLNEAWVPRYYKIMSEEQRSLKEVKSYSCWWLVGVGTCCLGIMLFTTDVINILATKDYSSSSQFVPVMVFSFLVMGIYHFGVNPLFYHKKTKWIPWVSGGAAVLNILLNLMLIPKLGALGAAVSTLLAQGAMAIIFHSLSRKLDPMPYPYLAGVIPILVLGGLALWLSFWQDLSLLPFLYRLVILLIGLLSFIPLIVSQSQKNYF